MKYDNNTVTLLLSEQHPPHAQFMRWNVSIRWIPNVRVLHNRITGHSNVRYYKYY